jgi:hypothetical protein
MHAITNAKQHNICRFNQTREAICQYTFETDKVRPNGCRIVKY